MRVKTMLEAEIGANETRTVYFGQGKVGDNCVESVYIQVLEGAIADLRGSIKTDGEEIEGQAITGFKLADFTTSYEAEAGEMLLVPTEGLSFLTIEAGADGAKVIVKAIG